MSPPERYKVIERAGWSGTYLLDSGKVGGRLGQAPGRVKGEWR